MKRIYTLCKPNKVQFTYNTRQSQFMSLGGQLDLLLNNHHDKAEKKANKTLGLIKRTSTFINKSVLISLYKALVRPHLEYGNVIWYPCPKRQSAAVE